MIEMKAILKNFRVTRQLHALEMFAFGVALSGTLKIGIFEVFEVILQTVFTCIFVIITNDLCDIEIDKISNPTRPLISGQIKRNDYILISISCLVGAFLISLHLGLYALVSFISVTLLYSVYSLPPFRLKRIPIISKLIIALNTVIYTIFGFKQSGGTDFPMNVLFILLIPGSFSMNLIDLKDEKGDKQSNIKTLPVLIGSHNTKIVVSISFTICDILLPLQIGHFHLAFSVGLLVAILQCYFIFKEPFNELPVMSLYLISLFILFLFHLIPQIPIAANFF